jgi:hypothetical protein
VANKLGKVVHVEGGFTVVEILEDLPDASGRLLGYSLFGVGTDIRKLYSREGAVAALRDRVTTQNA